VLLNVLSGAVLLIIGSPSWGLRRLQEEIVKNIGARTIGPGVHCQWRLETDGVISPPGARLKHLGADFAIGDAGHRRHGGRRGQTRAKA
jgi:hypothetical protein